MKPKAEVLYVFGLKQNEDGLSCTIFKCTCHGLIGEGHEITFYYEDYNIKKINKNMFYAEDLSKDSSCKNMYIKVLG